MTPRQILLLIEAILAILILWAVVYFYNDYQALKAGKAALESTATVTAGATDALSTAQQAQQDIHFTIEDNRSKQDAAYAQVIQANPDAATWDATVIPDSVRNSDGSP